MSSSRITDCFARLKANGQRGFIPFIMAGDPDLATSAEILAGLPEAGADIIEIGMPFSDPMADGPAIQAAGLRALKAGVTLDKILQMVQDFRRKDAQTPIILMGYYNPIYRYGVDNFVQSAKQAGVDGLIIVDLPPEEDAELCDPARTSGLDFIRLLTPTSDAARRRKILAKASGFLYYVSVTGITGAATGETEEIATALEAIRRESDLPIAVGFGIKTADQVALTARHADAVVVGSAIVSEIAVGKSAVEVLDFVAGLTAPLKNLQQR